MAARDILPHSVNCAKCLGIKFTFHCLYFTEIAYRSSLATTEYCKPHFTINAGQTGGHQTRQHIR